MHRRENTFRVDYSNVPVKPSYQDVHEFIAGELNLQREQVVRVQCSKTLNCAFVKVVDLTIAQRIVEEHGDQHEVMADGKAYPVRIVLEDGAVQVRVTDLSEDVTNEAIVGFLREFGEVLSVRDELWGEGYRFEGFPNGVRVVRMTVKENIPSYVKIDGETTAVYYYGQRQTCRHCEEFVHNGASCVQNKKLLIQKLASDQTNKPTYANVAKGKQPARATNKRQNPTERFKQLGPLSNHTNGQQTAKPKPGFQLRGTQLSKPNMSDTDLMPPPLQPNAAEEEPIPGPSGAGKDGNASDTSSASTESSKTRRKKLRVD